MDVVEAVAARHRAGLIGPCLVSAAVIRRRHVIYVEGYDPQGAEGYYGLFERAWRRFLEDWPVEAGLGESQLESQDFAHWDIEAAGPNWQVATRYEFLRQEHIIRANMAEPLASAGSARAGLGVRLSRQRSDLPGAACFLGVRPAC